MHLRYFVMCHFFYYFWLVFYKAGSGSLKWSGSATLAQVINWKTPHFKSSILSFSKSETQPPCRKHTIINICTVNIRYKHKTGRIIFRCRSFLTWNGLSYCVTYNKIQLNHTEDITKFGNFRLSRRYARRYEY